jgi:hypothetical protein
MHVLRRVTQAALLHGGIGALGVVEKAAIPAGRGNMLAQRSHHDRVRGFSRLAGELLQLGLERGGQLETCGDDGQWRPPL